MWAFASRRFRRYVLLALGFPLVAAAMVRLGDALEQRRGSSMTSRALQGTGGWLYGRASGPLARRLRAARDEAQRVREEAGEEYPDTSF